MTTTPHHLAASCRCRNTDPNQCVARWSGRAKPRVTSALKQGAFIDFDAVKHEALLAAGVGKGSDEPFLEHNLRYDHLCPDCPVRLLNGPARETLGSDR